MKHPAAHANEQQVTENIIQYYIDTQEDYELAWHLTDAHGLHFGYQDNRRISLPDSIINMNAVISRKARINRNSNVLDCGCGIGGTAIWIARHIGCKITGISITPDQIDQANKLARSYSVNHLTTFRAGSFDDASVLGDPQSYDAAYFIESFCHSFDPARTLKTIYSVLRPGATLVLGGFFLGEHCKPDSRMSRLFERGWAMAPLRKISTIRHELECAGFSVLSEERARKKVAASSRKLCVLAALSTPYEIWGLMTGSRKKSHWDNTMASILQYPELMRGGWEYGIITAEKQ